MPSVGKLIVFVSSAADDDVADERIAARLAIDQSDMEFSGMENWPADSGTSIEEASLEHVHRSDVFVGVFGGRCGEMTRREFDEAVKNDIPRLLFFRRAPGKSPDESVVSSIDPEKRTVDQQRLADLHAKVATLKSSKFVYFDDAKDLAFHVVAALAKHYRKTQVAGKVSANSRPKLKVPEYLETLCNRDKQQTKVGQLLTDAIAGKNKLLIVGLSGPRLEDHHAFVDWYHFLRLHPDYASDKGTRKGLVGHDESRRRKIVSVAWPHNSGATLDGRFNELRGELASELLNTPEPTDDPTKVDSAIQQALAGVRQHVTIRHTIISGQCSNDESKLLARWLDYWRSLDLPFDGMRTTVFFCLREDHSGLNGWLFARRHMQACVEVLQARQSTTIIYTDPLKSPERIDVDRWAEERCRKHFPELNVEVLKRVAGLPFANQQRIPFEVVKTTLREALITAHEQYKR